MAVRYKFVLLKVFLQQQLFKLVYRGCSSHEIFTHLPILTAIFQELRKVYQFKKKHLGDFYIFSEEKHKS